MGLTFYLHLDRCWTTCSRGEPEARNRVRELLREIMTDELSTWASAATSSARSACA